MNRIELIYCCSVYCYEYTCVTSETSPPPHPTLHTSVVFWQDAVNIMFPRQVFCFTEFWTIVLKEEFKAEVDCFFTTHSTHFIYGVRHMVKDHSDSERGIPLPPHGILFLISSKGRLYASSNRQDNTYPGLCYTSRRALAGTRNSSMGPPIALQAKALTTELHLSPLRQK